MRARDKVKACIFYPEDAFKVNWDPFITIILLISCILTPLRIAFGGETEPLGWEIINNTIDVFFLFDIIIIFNSAFYDDDYNIIDDRWALAKAYFHSWFFIDFLAIVPFERFVNVFDSDKSHAGGNYQEIVRLTRIGRMYKLIKMTKLLRILKIIK
jgi:hypothetical protein